MVESLFSVFLFCVVIETLCPGWALPQVKTWPIRVLLVNLVQIAIVWIAGLTWEIWLSSWSIFQLSSHLSVFSGGLLAYFLATFVFYWWHRWRHEVQVLWLAFHQIHHSPQRLEVITSFYKHPGEMVFNSFLGSLIVYTLLGLSLEAGVIYTACTAIGEFFYHTNIRTPQWIGYIFQRPEMHRIHHQHHYHKNNYGDIVWWDMLFGTYENPETWDNVCGFEEYQEQQLLPMLAYHDVHTQAQKD